VLTATAQVTEPVPGGSAAAGPGEEPLPAEVERAALMRRRAIMAGIGVVVVIALFAGAILLGRHSGHPKTVPAQATHKGIPANFVTYRDPADGFSIAYPRNWTRTVPPGNGLALLLDVGGTNAVSVRVIGLQSPVRTAQQLADVKKVTDGILGTANNNIQILHQETFRLNGMPGYYYLYTFPGANGGTGGVHAQYFVFQGRAMNELVFQAVPASDFSHLAPVFDQVANTFHSDPSFVPPAPTTTVAPSTTAAPATPPPATTAPPAGH